MYYPHDSQLIFPLVSSITSIFLICLIPAMGYLALRIVANWKLFEKAGENGWAAVVPFYSSYTLYKITWGNGWLFLLLYVPLANFVIEIITMVKLSQAFGKEGGWACGLIFLNLIFLCIMAFSSDFRYVGVPGQSGYGDADASSGQQDYQNPYSQSSQQSSQNSQYYYQQTASANTPKFCPACGVALEGTPKFCHKCGKQL